MKRRIMISVLVLLTVLDSFIGLSITVFVLSYDWLFQWEDKQIKREVDKRMNEVAEIQYRAERDAYFTKFMNEE